MSTNKHIGGCTAHVKYFGVGTGNNVNKQTNKQVGDVPLKGVTGYV